MKNTIMITSLFALSTLALSVNAQSSSYNDKAEGLYLGANYGYLRVDGDDEFEDDKDAYQLYTGYSFNEHFAIEGSYLDFGDYGNDAISASTDGFTLGLRAGLPITESLNLYVKGGQLWYETDYRVTSFRSDYENEGLFAGLGLGYKLTENLSIKFDYTLYDVDLDFEEAVDDFDDANFSTDLKQAAIGVEYLF